MVIHGTEDRAGWVNTGEEQRHFWDSRKGGWNIYSLYYLIFSKQPQNLWCIKKKKKKKTIIFPAAAGSSWFWPGSLMHLWLSWPSHSSQWHSRGSWAQTSYIGSGALPCLPYSVAPKWVTCLAQYKRTRVPQRCGGSEELTPSIQHTKMMGKFGSRAVRL